MDEGGEPIRLRERAYASFTRHLLARDVRPGQFVSQRELVALTGLPLGAIRELVPRLEAEGLLITVPQRGIQIAHIDLNLIREAFQFRLFLEQEAVALFTASAPDTLLARLRREHEDALARAASPATSRRTSRNRPRRSTGTCTTPSSTPWTTRSSPRPIGINSIKMRLINQERFRIDGRVVPVMREHLAILDAIESREPQRAVEAMTQHIDNARNLALRV